MQKKDNNTDSKSFGFEIIHQSKRSGARVGRITTPHGTIETPSFVAVGTNGTLKAMDNILVCDLGVDLMFCNTYHLLVHPGVDVVAEFGGLHDYISRDKPIITDSGGFQVFSLAYGSVANELKSIGKKKMDSAVIKIDESGVKFRSYRDGSIIHLTPESSIDAQKKLGADIIIPFDELPPFHMGTDALLRSFRRTHRWMKRSLSKHLESPNNQAIYGVVHGGLDSVLRRESAIQLSNDAWDGLALGGSFGQSHADLEHVLAVTSPHLVSHKPRHLLGIGDFKGIDLAVNYGMDTMDSSYPTKLARHGQLLRGDEKIKIGQTQWRNAKGPIDADCQCYTCQNYQLGYLHHLYKAREPTFATLASIHNIHAITQRMHKIREDILSGCI